MNTKNKLNKIVIPQVKTTGFITDLRTIKIIPPENLQESTGGIDMLKKEIKNQKKIDLGVTNTFKTAF